MKIKKLCVIGIVSLILGNVFAEESVYFIRHGEKPENGLGQINCQGLNRSLALPSVIDRKIGKPDYLFASNPSKQKEDRGIIYDYIRPLATIEPTAVYYSMPINVQIGFEEDDKLIAEILNPKYENSKIIVAWEHRLAEQVVRKMVDNYGTKEEIPTWKSKDFDSIYIIKINKINNEIKVTFNIDTQNLNELPITCLFGGESPRPKGRGFF